MSCYSRCLIEIVKISQLFSLGRHFCFQLLFVNSKLPCAPLIKVSTIVFPQLTSCKFAERDTPENKTRMENLPIAMGKESIAYFRSASILKNSRINTKFGLKMVIGSLRYSVTDYKVLGHFLVHVVRLNLIKHSVCCVDLIYFYINQTQLQVF